ncbi:hypothetical protein TNCV_634961 [Trichonephila clavipes]|nr:hypothetical protein TNCV_634961 [Trichonephila clavipes]
MLERFLEIKSAILKALIDIKEEQLMANVECETVTTIVAGLEPLKVGLEKIWISRKNLTGMFLLLSRLIKNQFYGNRLPRGFAGRTATAGSDVVQSGRPTFDDFFQHLWPYVGYNTANVVFQMVKRL